MNKEIDLSNFWCSCKSKEFKDHDIIETRGHSVDVYCGDCGGCLQVGQEL